MKLSIKRKLFYLIYNIFVKQLPITYMPYSLENICNQTVEVYQKLVGKE